MSCVKIRTPLGFPFILPIYFICNWLDLYKEETQLNIYVVLGKSGMNACSWFHLLTAETVPSYSVHVMTP